jgi:DNA-directed RNA polymerase specialized sigma24 family protein
MVADRARPRFDTGSQDPKGAAEALELAQSYYPAMVRLARQLMPEPAAQAAVREAFVEIARAPIQGPGVGSVLRKLLVRSALRQGGPSARELAALLPSFDASGHHAAAPRRWSATVAQAGPEVRARFRQCVDRLPAPHRVAYVLSDVEALGPATCADLMGLPLAEFKNQLHAARLALCTLFSGAGAAVAGGCDARPTA